MPQQVSDKNVQSTDLQRIKPGAACFLFKHREWNRNFRFQLHEIAESTPRDCRINAMKSQNWRDERCNYSAPPNKPTLRILKSRLRREILQIYSKSFKSLFLVRFGQIWMIWLSLRSPIFNSAPNGGTLLEGAECLLKGAKKIKMVKKT